ncbi:hypothetical protein KC950_04305, partial [Candidatus Saccharibacteria bacterium]|nr:hypothetical protein [Candidatus Saccharibacteria bacterium]
MDRSEQIQEIFSQATSQSPEFSPATTEDLDIEEHVIDTTESVINDELARDNNIERARKLVERARSSIINNSSNDETEPIQLKPSSVIEQPESKSGNFTKRARDILIRTKTALKDVFPPSSYVKTRPATPEDIDELVDVDIEAFSSVYQDYDISLDEWRSGLIQKFHGRLSKVSGEWMRVFEKEGKIAGFITSCPTSKTPEDFVNWEDTTDNGTLDSTFDQDGENVYVVSLSMLAEGSSIKGQNMLFGDQIGKFISEQYKRAFFESRMPGFRRWLMSECRTEGLNFDALSSEEKDSYAEKYFNLTTEIDGKQVPKDRLLRMYDSVGCKLIKVVPDAYQDKPSLNYGV